MTKKQVVLDTNCLIQIISRRSPNYFLWELFIDGVYNLCITNEILEEYEEILCQKTNQRIASFVIEIIRKAPNTYEYDASYRWNVITSDPDDNKFIDCAVVANADFIVTEDKHFNEAKNTAFPHVDIISLDDFAKIYRPIIS